MSISGDLVAGKSPRIHSTLEGSLVDGVVEEGVSGYGGRGGGEGEASGLGGCIGVGSGEVEGSGGSEGSSTARSGIDNYGGSEENTGNHSNAIDNNNTHTSSPSKSLYQVKPLKKSREEILTMNCGNDIYNPIDNKKKKVRMNVKRRSIVPMFSSLLTNTRC